mgnify:CR=1 FL=1
MTVPRSPSDTPPPHDFRSPGVRLLTYIVAGTTALLVISFPLIGHGFSNEELYSFLCVISTIMFIAVGHIMRLKTVIALGVIMALWAGIYQSVITALALPISLSPISAPENISPPNATAVTM